MMGPFFMFFHLKLLLKLWHMWIRSWKLTDKILCCLPCWLLIWPLQGREIRSYHESRDRGQKVPNSTNDPNGFSCYQTDEQRAVQCSTNRKLSPSQSLVLIVLSWLNPLASTSSFNRWGSWSEGLGGLGLSGKQRQVEMRGREKKKWMHVNRHPSICEYAEKVRGAPQGGVYSQERQQLAALSQAALKLS